MSYENNAYDRAHETMMQKAGSFLTRRRIIGGVSAVALLLTGTKSFFTVDPTDVAFVRHYDGSISDTMYTSGGLHFKWPFVDTVDRLQVSEDQITIPRITVNATDDPGITLKVTLNAKIKGDNLRKYAYHLLYEVGRSGNVDIRENMVPVISSRVLQTIAAGKATALTTGMQATQAGLQTDLSNLLGDRFGYDVKNFNISEIDLGDTYRASSEKVVNASNDSLKSTYEAAKTVTEAKAQADKQIEEARGRAQSSILIAEANLTAAKDNANAAAEAGSGEKRRLDAIIQAFGGADKYLTYVMYEKWGGGVPQTVLNGNGSGSVNTLLVPSLPAFAPTGAVASPAPKS